MPADLSRVAFVQAEYRQTLPLEDLTVKARDPLATELVFSTLLENKIDADAFAAEVLALRKISRFDWQALILRDRYVFNIGDTITIKYPRYGLSGGGNFIVKRIRRDHRSPFLQVTLFGPQ